MSESKIYIYPIWLRIWHVFNAILCLILIVTGLSIQYSSPDAFITFRTSVKFHNIAGILLLINYFTFIIGNAHTTNGNHYKIIYSKILPLLKVQFRYYTYGIFKKEHEPFPITKERKFNPLQQATYILVMYIFCPLIIGTGILMLFPEKMGDIAGINSYTLVALLHISSGFIISIFMIIHIYFSTITHNNKIFTRFKSIITGYHYE